MLRTRNLAAAALLLAPLLAAAQEARVPKITVSGMVDSYYTLNLTHAQDYAVPTNGPSAEPGFNLNFAKVTTIAELAPVTLRLDLGYGRFALSTTDVLVQQAFVSMKLGQVTVDAGRFVTPCGFEVFEAKDNWLYSHGLLFNFAMPTAHEGVRATIAPSEEWTLSGYLANGGDLWNNDVGGTRSPYKTFIANAVWARGASTLNGTLFVTKNPATAQDGYLVDVSFTRGLGQADVNLSADLGNFSSNAGLPGYGWFGLGVSGRIKLSDQLKVAGRLEFLDDSDGGRVGTSTGVGNFAPLFPGGANYLSLTAGGSYAVGQNAELKAELRLDKASEDVYRSGKDTAATVHLAAIAWF